MPDRASPPVIQSTPPTIMTSAATNAQPLGRAMSNFITDIADVDMDLN